ncbi:hypothetical protein HPB50_025514 [Hyalomma asiaticum]|uniref:Uncharacterized protein n=1 Tax=Hyalomma asiaticum TaxID=266040 RepID=A0ACB7SQE4_HYAAI|nr:hypothetical protein HPB50_025514 [Hyalomma asiaticum]
MEIAKRKRRVIRAQATRIINEADDILAKQATAPDIVAVSGLIERLLLVQNQLSDVNAAIEPHILEEDADAEFEQAMEYDDKIASRLGSMKSFGKNNCKEEYVFDALEVPTICEQVIPCPDEQVKETLRELSLPLGDDSIEQDATIDVLIGSDQFWECLTRRIKKLNSKLTAMETVFGWAVQGPTVSKCKAVNCAQVVVLRSSVTDQQTEPIPRLFSELEGVGVSDTPEKLPGVQIMEQFTKGNKTVDGRYEPSLTMAVPNEDLPPGFTLSSTTGRSRAYDLLLREAGRILNCQPNRVPLSPRRRTRRTKRHTPVRPSRRARQANVTTSQPAVPFPSTASSQGPFSLPDPPLQPAEEAAASILCTTLLAQTPSSSPTPGNERDRNARQHVEESSIPEGDQEQVHASDLSSSSSREHTTPPLPEPSSPQASDGNSSQLTTAAETSAPASPGPSPTLTKGKERSRPSCRHCRSGADSDSATSRSRESEDEVVVLASTWAEDSSTKRSIDEED